MNQRRSQVINRSPNLIKNMNFKTNEILSQQKSPLYIPFINNNPNIIASNKKKNTVAVIKHRQ